MLIPPLKKRYQCTGAKKMKKKGIESKVVLVLMSLTIVCILLSTLIVEVAADSRVKTIPLRYYQTHPGTEPGSQILAGTNDFLALSTLTNHFLVGDHHYLYAGKLIIDATLNEDTGEIIMDTDRTRQAPVSGVALNYHNKKLYSYVCSGSGHYLDCGSLSVLVIDVDPFHFTTTYNTVIRTIHSDVMDYEAYARNTNIAVDQRSGSIYYVQNGCDDFNGWKCDEHRQALVVIDGNTDTVIRHTELPSSPIITYIIFSNGFLYGACGNDVCVMDTNGRILEYIHTPLPPSSAGGASSPVGDPHRIIAIAADAMGENIYVAAHGPPDTTLLQPDPRYHLKGTHGFFTCQPGYVFKISRVASFGFPRVSLPIEVGPCPSAIEYDPHNGKIYVSNENTKIGLSPGTLLGCGPGTVSVIDELALQVEVIPVGVCPNSIDYDPINGNIYVYNFGTPPQFPPSDERGAPANIDVISTVHPSISGIRGEIIDDLTGAEVTGQTVPFGRAVHAESSLIKSWYPLVPEYTPPKPTGTISYQRFFNPNCDIRSDTPTPIQSETLPLASDGSTQPSGFHFKLAFLGGVSYKIRYSGDENYSPAETECISVLVSKPEITTKVIAKNSDVTNGVVQVGTRLHDTASITGRAGTPINTMPIGQVTYYLFNNPKCDGLPIRTQTVSIRDGNVPNSMEFTVPSGLDGVSYNATYEDKVDGGCESVYIGRLLISILNQFDDDVTNTQVPTGTIVHARVQAVSEGGSLNSVILHTYKNANCAPEDVSSPPELLDLRQSGGAESNRFTIGNGVNIISFKAIFSNNLESDCVSVVS
jgi:DNA-binding beta-propeller fold protein YncE